MIIFEILMAIIETFIFLYALANFINYVRVKKYQKLWYKEKVILLRAKPRVSNAEICERYVMFCKRNDCKVEY